MDRIKLKKRTIIGLTTGAITAAVVIPIAVVYGIKNNESSSSDADVLYEEYPINKQGVFPIKQFEQVPGFKEWEAPVYTLDKEVQVSEVTMHFKGNDKTFTDKDKFSFLSEFYLYDENNNKIDYQITEYTEIKSGITNGTTEADWLLPSKDLWLIKKFLTDGEVGPQKTIDEVIGANQFTKERLAYQNGSSGVNLVLKREDFARSRNYNRILLLDYWQSRISTQRIKIKLDTPKKLDRVSYYFASSKQTDFTFSFKTVNGSTYEAANPKFLTNSGEDANEYRNKIATGTQELKDQEYSESLTIKNSEGEPPFSYTQNFLPIDKGTVNYKPGEVTLNTASNFYNFLTVGDTFTATYKTSKDPLSKEIDVPTTPPTKVVKYKVVKGAPAPIQEGTAAEKFFFNNSTQLPKDKSTQVEGWLEWTAKYTNGSTEYKTLDELKALPIDSTFLATYTALKDPRYTTTKDQVYVVPYKVAASVTSSPGNTTPEKKLFLVNSTSLPIDKSGASAPGYLNWSEPTYYLASDPSIKYTKLEEIIALPYGTKFIASYLAKRGLTSDATYKVEHTVVGVPGPYPGNTTPENKIFVVSDKSTMPNDKSGPSAIGYFDWTVKFKSGTTEYTTLDQLKKIDPTVEFDAIYTALRDPNYGATQDAVYTVRYAVRILLEPTENQVYPYSDYVAGNPAPNFFAPTGRRSGYLKWGTAVYKQGDVIKTPDEIRALSAGQKFTAVYTAEVDLESKNYFTGINEPAIVTVEYTIKAL